MSELPPGSPATTMGEVCQVVERLNALGKARLVGAQYRLGHVDRVDQERLTTFPRRCTSTTLNMVLSVPLRPRDPRAAQDADSPLTFYSGEFDDDYWIEPGDLLIGYGRDRLQDRCLARTTRAPQSASSCRLRMSSMQQRTTLWVSSSTWFKRHLNAIHEMHIGPSPFKHLIVRGPSPRASRCLLPPRDPSNVASSRRSRSSSPGSMPARSRYSGRSATSRGCGRRYSQGRRRGPAGAAGSAG